MGMSTIAAQVERLPWRVLLPLVEVHHSVMLPKPEDDISVVCDLEAPGITVIVVRAASFVANRIVWLHNEALKRGDILAKTP